MAKIPKPPSLGEETMAFHFKLHKLEPVREFVFDPSRKWRADFCFEAERLLIEVDGGTWNGGRHTRGKGFAEDCAKTNRAVVLGYRVLRFTSKMVTSGEAINVVLEALRG